MTLKLSARVSLYIAIILLSVMSASFTYEFFTHMQVFKRLGLDEAGRLSEMVFDELHTSMKHGGTHEELSTIITRLSAIEGIEEIHIVHGPTLTRQFGTNPENLPRDEYDREAVSGRTIKLIESNGSRAARTIMPLFNKSECTRCHNGAVNEVNGAISVRVSLKKFDTIFLAQSIETALWDFGIILITGVAIYLIIRRRFLNPLDKLSEATRKLASGNLDYRVGIATGDEIEDLGDAFDKMASDLGDHINKYSKLVDASPDAILLIDPLTSTIIDANPAAALITGYTGDELSGMSAEKIFPFEGCGPSGRLLSNSGNGAVTAIDARISRKDGSALPVDITTSSLEIGSRPLVQGIIRDITERKSFEKAREEYEAELERDVQARTAELESSIKELDESRRAVIKLLGDMERGKKEWEETVDSFSDPLFVHDEQFRIVRTNRAYKDLAGVSFKEIIGRPYHEVFPRMNGPFDWCRDLSAITGVDRPHELMIPETGRIYHMRHYALPETEHGRLYAHVMEDVTEEKKAQETILQEKEITSNLLSIAEATAKTTDMDRLIIQVVGCVNKILSSDHTLAYLWDAASEVLRPGHADGLRGEQVPFFMTEPLDMEVPFVAEAFAAGVPLVVKVPPGRPNEPRSPGCGLYLWCSELDTLAVIPLKGRQNKLGLLVCIYGERNRKIASGLTRWDVELMAGIAHQASRSLEEARLYKDTVDKTMELSHKIETIVAMHEMDKNILSTLEPQEILDLSASMIYNLVPCDSTEILTVNKDSGVLHHAANMGSASAFTSRSVPIENSMAAEVIDLCRPRYVPDLSRLTRRLALDDEMMDMGFLSILWVPVMVRGEVDAILSLAAKRRAAFLPDDLDTTEKLASQIGVALENARILKDMESLFIGTVKTLSATIDAKSPWTRGHSDRVTELALWIGRGMGLEDNELKDLELGAILHDIGKIGTYEDILNKTGPLTAVEKNEIHRHPEKGAEIISSIPQLKGVIPIIRHHHEYYDGTGYPDGLKGEDIPLLARVLSVADAVDAMSADRPYRKGIGMDGIIPILVERSEIQFDPAVVEAFVKTISE